MQYKTPGAFRAALEQRLNEQFRNYPGGLVRLRKMVAFERFLARVQASDDKHWLLKGGFALQLRLGNRARMTKDIDLSADLGLFSGKDASPEGLHQVLVEESSRDLEDFFAIRVEASRQIALNWN